VGTDLAVLGVHAGVVLISPLLELFELSIIGGVHERIGKHIVEHVHLVRVRVRVRIMEDLGSRVSAVRTVACKVSETKRRS